MARDPACRFADALRFFQAIEPRVLDERRAALTEQRIPGLPRDVLDAGDDAQLQRQATSFRTSVNHASMTLPPLVARPIDTWVDTFRM